MLVDTGKQIRTFYCLPDTDTFLTFITLCSSPYVHYEVFATWHLLALVVKQAYTNWNLMGSHKVCSFYSCWYLQTSDWKMFLILIKEFKLIFEPGSGIIQTENGSIFPTSRPLMKNFLYIICLIYIKKLNIDFQSRKWTYIIRKWNHFSHFQASKFLLQIVSNF